MGGIFVSTSCAPLLHSPWAPGPDNVLSHLHPSCRGARCSQRLLLGPVRVVGGAVGGGRGARRRGACTLSRKTALLSPGLPSVSAVLLADDTDYAALGRLGVHTHDANLRVVVSRGPHLSSAGARVCWQASRPPPAMHVLHVPKAWLYSATLAPAPAHWRH